MTRKTRVFSLLLPILFLGIAYRGATAQEQSGRFSQTGSMTMPRRDHTATLLSNGKVLIAGGSHDDSILTSAELYDPSSGTVWSRRGIVMLPVWQNLPDCSCAVAPRYAMPKKRIGSN